MRIAVSDVEAPRAVTDPPAGGIEPEALQDGPFERRFWRAFARIDALIGPHRARGLAAVVIRRLARSEHGYTKSIYRIASHTSSAAPDIVRIPERWSTATPRVRVRRLGLDLDLDLRDNLQRTLYFTGTYEPGVLRFIRRELRPGDVFVDVGAHVGVHALTAARRLRELGRGRVYAFEPTRDSAAGVRASAVRNGLEVEVVEAALGAEQGTVDLYADPAYGVDDAGVRSQYGTGRLVQRIPVTTFDAWAAETGLERLDLVKIDVEGAEPLVLRGMAESLDRLRPRALIVEMKAATLERAGTDAGVVWEMLTRHGYGAAGRPLLFHNQVVRRR
jgi:FkbM family methyltransferase